MKSSRKAPIGMGGFVHSLFRESGPSCAETACKLFDFMEGVQFWIKDRKGRYGWVNRGFLLNYSLEHREQVLGKTDFDLSPAYLADQFRLDDERVLRGEAILGRIELVGRFDHTSSWSVTHKLPLRDGRGRICATAGITRPLDSNAKLDVHDEALNRVMAWVRQDYGRTWTNAAMAKEARLSVRAFERHFRKQFHMSPQCYFRRLKVRMAAHALIFSAAPLSQIAVDFGFADQSHFTREFRRETTWTPRKYRQRFGAH